MAHSSVKLMSLTFSYLDRIEIVSVGMKFVSVGMKFVSVGMKFVSI